MNVALKPDPKTIIDGHTKMGNDGSEANWLMAVAFYKKFGTTGKV